MSRLRRRFDRLSIRGKLLAAVLALIGFSFSLACVGLIVDHRRTARDALVDNVSILADVVGDTCRAALVFDDPDTARTTLGALHANEHIERAVLFDRHGDVFATFPAHDRRPLPDPVPAAGTHRIDSERLWLSRAVALDETRVGTLLIASDLEQWTTSLLTFARVAVVLFVVILLLAFALALRLQRRITEPIHELARVVRRTADGEYDVRARKHGQDELGELVDGFNAMLEEIETRDEALTRARDALARHVAALEASNAELEQFAYVASHDLQEPLRGIAGCLQLLERRYDAAIDDEGRELIGHAVDGASRMKALIGDLLGYSRVNRAGGEVEPVDCDEVYRGVLRDLSVAIDEVGARVTHDPLPTVVGDARQLSLVFQNLISNALKFRGERTPEVHVGAERGDGEWIFTVTDNGIGIEPRFRERIFEIFQRLHTSAEYDGTGIGLAITRKIVARHRGKIWLDGEPGHGTRFSFTIPDAEEFP